MEVKGKNRKPYNKPQIQQVKLIVEEAVLAGCKTTASVPAQTNRSCNNFRCQYTGS